MRRRAARRERGQSEVVAGNGDGHEVPKAYIETNVAVANSGALVSMVVYGLLISTIALGLLHITASGEGHCNPHQN